LVLVEVEYLRAMRQAELAWVQSFQQELQTGAFRWDTQKLLRCGATMPRLEGE
jgi:hypothetical protein